MARSLLALLDDRSEAVFLPAISFGYIFANYDSLAVCPSVVELPSLDFTGGVFIWLGLVSTITGSIIYGVGENQEKPGSLQDIFSLPMFVSFIHVFLMIVSIMEIVARACSGNVVILSLSFLYIALPVIRVTEDYYQ